jgi:mannose-6-phosphate isomerase
VRASLHLLEPAIRTYAWGSRTFLAALRGDPGPSPEPEAELWFGAHPSAPARLVDRGTSLLDLIAADPVGTLGADVAGRFGDKLPFLVKILAADQPLSLQVHPSVDQARQGYAREEATGPGRDDPDRNYRDPWPKPELLAALTSVHALCGFRDPADTVALLDALDAAPLAHVRTALDERGEDAFPHLMEGALRGDGWPPGDRDVVAGALARVAGEGGAFAAEARWLGRLLERYPTDGGVEVALLLRLVELAPGEALALPDGNLHAYLEGAGVEVMASSDNVVRGGLTPKHVDVEELLRLVDARVLPPPVVTPTTSGPETLLPAPTGFFALSRIEVDGAAHELDRARGGPEILVVTSGRVTVRSAGEELTVPRGGGVFVGAGATAIAVAGTGQVHRARVGGRGA